MTLQEFLGHAKVFAALGDAIGEQVEAVAQGGRFEDQNAAALRLAARQFLKPLLRDLLYDADNDELREGVRDLIDDIQAHLDRKAIR